MTGSRSILILGGTTEGRKAVTVVDGSGNNFLYSTKEGEIALPMTHGTMIRGAMGVSEMRDCCQSNDVGLIVDAAHPFASNLHTTIADVAASIGIPVIRYERQYPSPKMAGHVIWCDNYDEVIRRLESDGIRRALILTGVQSIARLYARLRDCGVDSVFRILRRQSSIDKAREAGLPADKLIYLEDSEDDAEVFSAIAPDAIVLKESGESGNFAAKVDTAVSQGMKVYALRRPVLPQSFITVDGPHGLRREIERLLPDFFQLHTGLTTGTCATAASIAAVGRSVNQIADGRQIIKVVLPDGEMIRVEADVNPHCSSVIKDAGSDPDVTDGMTIEATVRINDCTPGIVNIDGGRGVGRATLPGLDMAVGEAAINRVPRKMIEDNIRRHYGQLLVAHGLDIIISCPEGEEIAAKTFNPRLGIKGGISIIGTSGIVQPFSTDAFVSSIRKSLSVGIATGTDTIVLNSGARSERAVRNHMPQLPPQAFVHYGNFIGKTLEICREYNVANVVMGVMIGKAVKLAEGNLDTHSRNVTMNHEFIVSMLMSAGAEEHIIRVASRITLARELLTLLPEATLLKFSNEVLKRCYEVCKPIIPGSALKLLLIDDDLNILCEY